VFFDKEYWFEDCGYTSVEELWGLSGGVSDEGQPLRYIPLK